ncbi:7TM diverse intracellular signaling domain-containing protein [Mariniflexile sp. AS56]|uniref:7TM diverse intracellular signaling domain-containing protein n=1 Tax=Mariniflexile sp. AS56 TaxID=3063957 RepID=UPI0026EDC4E5|nr:7TM diverse intracellular signaling domain-containing protein [Mariniflexile sp. AS56]MDO7173495.1 7TM diverse intracellular signaling domain-containing protein [Mariniflexile sp. AS56]
MKHLLLFVYILSSCLYAQNSIFETKNDKDNLYTFAEYANAGSLDFDIQDIINDSKLRYEPLESDNHSVGFTTDNYWLRFKIKNSSENTSVYYLETARPITDIANLFQISKESIQHFKSGDKIPFESKQVNHRSTVFKLTLPPQETQQIYIHLKSDGETINLPLKLYSESGFLLMNYKQQLFLGLFYGLLFLGGIIYLFFYSSLKEKSFLYYGFYVFSIGFMQAALDGFLHEFMFPNAGYFNDRAVLITALLSNFFLLKYCEHFLRVRQLLKPVLKGFNVIYGIIAVLFIMLFISPATLKIAYPISNLNGLFSLLLILATIFTMRYRRITIDPYFSFGILFLVIGLLGFVMNNLSLLPNNFLTLNSAKFGSGFEVIFLSLSMTNLIRLLRLEKEESQLEALKKSEEISELKTYFMSNMSHELRTPINAIMGIAEHELATQQNNENRKPYEIIKNASLSLLSNVNDIIDFEKIENNELQLCPDDFNPSIKLNQISNNWKAEAQRKGLEYTFEMDAEIPATINADAERFIQIVNNVLSNAVKYTETGGVLFKLSCTKQPNDLCRFSFQISDTGIGIPPEAKETIFDSFNQMKQDHKRQFGGIGLGLTIVKHIVKLFEGTIHIESNPNKGTDVFIDLTVKSTAEERIIITQQTTNDIPLHILIVEDNKLNQMIMRKILSSLPNVTFAVANNGQEALDTLKRDVYDLVLMDLQMPIMDGYEATRIIRSGELGSTINNIPIIAVTADALQETRKRVLDLGMNDYMTKPVDRDLLFKKIYACSFDKTNKEELDNEDTESLKIA